MVHPDALVDALAQMAFQTSARLSRLAAELDLTPTQLRVLGILRGRQVRMTELAAYLGVEKSSLSGLIDRAEKRGLVTRQPSLLDQRSIEVSLTREGEDRAAHATSRARGMVLPIVAALTDQERQYLQTLLEKALAPTVARS